MKGAFIAFAVLTAAVLAAGVVLVDREHGVTGSILLIIGVFGYISVFGMLAADAREKPLPPPEP